jgi:hypothetical protein
MSVADAILAFDGGYEVVDQRVRRCRRGAGPDLRLQVLDQLLVRRVELHPGRQTHPVLCASNTNNMQIRGYQNSKTRIHGTQSAEKDLATKLPPADHVYKCCTSSRLILCPQRGQQLDSDMYFRCSWTPKPVRWWLPLPVDAPPSTVASDSSPSRRLEYPRTLP